VYDTAFLRQRRLCTIVEAEFTRLRKGGENCKRDLATNLSLVLKETLDHCRHKAQAYGSESSYGSARLCTGLFRDRTIVEAGSKSICDTVYDTAFLRQLRRKALALLTAAPPPQPEGGR
jgi:hypothetical protein